MNQRIRAMGSSSPLSLSRGFTVERYSRVIDHCQDVEELRSLAKLLLKVWRQQADFNEHYVARLLRIKPTEPEQSEQSSP